MKKKQAFLRSHYAGSSIMLTTKHHKSIAIAEPFLKKLNANVIESVMDTDQLGTFSGEINRTVTPLECARIKCEWSFNNAEKSTDFALASEGSFGPHPFIPFIPCDHEILYFIDRKRGFHLHLSHISEKTNYRTKEVELFSSLKSFAEKVHFPSHALILRSSQKEIKSPIFKGLNSWLELEKAFEECLRNSPNGKVWVETDMRAHLNPSRMKVIGELAEKMANRLATLCPNCTAPGWGIIRQENGLPCSWCGLETALIKSETFGCVICYYEENKKPINGPEEADPSSCQYCNP